MLLNGQKVNNKMEVISILAEKNTVEVTMVVIDKQTEDLFDQLNVEITDDLGKTDPSLNSPGRSRPKMDDDILKAHKFQLKTGISKRLIPAETTG